MKNPLILIDSNSTASPFTAEQVQQLIALLKPQAMANQVGSSSFTANLSAISLSSSLSHNIDWIIDSGATDHIDNTSSKMIGTGRKHNGLYHFSFHFSQTLSLQFYNFFYFF
ncbi:hypothetical protein ACOSQ4_029273 [Xanthoceras sorbifolium]